MVAHPSASQQILVEEIQAFAEALSGRGLDRVSRMLRHYVLRRLDAPILDLEPDEVLDIEGTESFLNRVNYFVTRDTAPWEARVPLLKFLLDADAKGKVLDVYREQRSRRGREIPAIEALERALKKFAAIHMDAMFRVARTGEPEDASEFLKLFTETSFDVAKFLFEEAERHFGDPQSPGHDILPEVVVRMEERVFGSGVSEAESQAILDRMSYLFARLSVDALRRIDDVARKIKREREISIKLRPYQIESIQEYLAFLDQALPEIQRASTIADYLNRINGKKGIINSWEKKLMLHIDVRLGLKQYHNAITEDLLRRSRELEVDLVEHLRREPTPTGAGIQAELHHTLDGSLPVAAVVECAIRAEQFLRRARHADAAADTLRAEATARIRQIEERFREALGDFEGIIERIRALVTDARELRVAYKALLSEDGELRGEVEELRNEINDRLTHGIERLKMPSPNDTNKILRPD